jgi:hypothetical protein
MQTPAIMSANISLPPSGKDERGYGVVRATTWKEQAHPFRVESLPVSQNPPRIPRHRNRLERAEGDPARGKRGRVSFHKNPRLHAFDDEFDSRFSVFSDR